MRNCLFALLAAFLFAGCSAKNPGANQAAGSGVDVDLTRLSSTMVFAEVYNMVTTPEDYLGKTVKLSGPYYTSYYDEENHHYVIIEDATACCLQGLEFKWNGTHEYPADYPGHMEPIEVAGVFDSYLSFGQTCYYLAVNDLSIVN